MKTVKYHLVFLYNSSLNYIYTPNMAATSAKKKFFVFFLNVENPNKSAHIDKYSHVKGPFVSSVSCQYTRLTVQGFSSRLIIGYW